MPFGLSNSPKVFHRFFEVFDPLLTVYKNVLYLDDIRVILKDVFQIARQYELKLRLKKVILLYESSSPGQENIKSVVDCPIPRSYKNVHSYVGLSLIMFISLPNLCMI